MAKSVIFSMVAAAILDFVKYELYQRNRLRDPIFRLCNKFGENTCKNGRIIAKSVIFNMAAAAILDF